METTIPTKEIMQCLTLKINLKSLLWRVRIAAQIIRFGAFVAGCKCEIEMVVEG